MNELHFAPGACSFVPHVALELVRAATGDDFAPRLVKLHKGEHLTPEYLALNPDGQVPLLVADGRPLSQVVAICDWLDRECPAAGILPSDPCQYPNRVQSSPLADATALQCVPQLSQGRLP